MEKETVDKYLSFHNEVSKVDIEPYMFAGYMQNQHLNLLQELISDGNKIFDEYFSTVRQIMYIGEKHNLNMKNFNRYGLMGGEKKIKRTIHITHSFDEVGFTNHVDNFLKPLDGLLTDRYIMGFIPSYVLRDQHERIGKHSFKYNIKREQVQWLTPLYLTDIEKALGSTMMYYKLKCPELFAKNNVT